MFGWMDTTTPRAVRMFLAALGRTWKAVILRSAPVSFQPCELLLGMTS